MKLVGTLSSPCSRRVTINLPQPGLAFRHEPVSVFFGIRAFGPHPAAHATLTKAPLWS
jgi:glutathione S-transferase